MLRKRNRTIAILLHRIITLQNLFPGVEVDQDEVIFAYIEEENPEGWTDAFNQKTSRAKNYLRTRIKNLVKMVNDGTDIDTVLEQEVIYKRRPLEKEKAQLKHPINENGIAKHGGARQSLTQNPGTDNADGFCGYDDCSKELSPGKQTRAFYFYKPKGEMPC